jgi:O-antigen/teichoic acid export membrane protein
MNKMKIKAAIWTLVVLMVLVLIVVSITSYTYESLWILTGLSFCLVVWAIYNIILSELKNKNE